MPLDAYMHACHNIRTQAFKLLENFIVGAKKYQEIRRIYDVACGHGLTGILIAYRFPRMHVISIDVQVSTRMYAVWIGALYMLIYAHKLQRAVLKMECYSVCPSVCLSDCLTVCLSDVCLSINLCIYFTN